MTIVKTISKNIIKRAWNDLEPKLLAFLTTGLTATLLIGAADYVGIKLDPALASVIVVVVGSIAGYIKSSTNKVDLTTPPAPVVGE